MQPQRNWRDLMKPQNLEADDKTPNATYGKFVGEPFERGFGTTIGNALRRVLLSSLQGAAITAVKIDGVLHEFATLPGVREDVTDIVLNLKEVRLKLHEGLEARAQIEAKGEGTVYARDIQVGPNVEILNPDLQIATPVEGRRAAGRADDQGRPRLRAGRPQQGRGRAGRHHSHRRDLLADPQGQLHRHQRARRPAHRLRPADDRGVDRRQRPAGRRRRLRGPHPAGPAHHLHQLRGRRRGGRSRRGGARRPSTRTSSGRWPSSSSRCARPTACRTPTSSTSASWCSAARPRC